MSNIEYHEGHLAICVKDRNDYYKIAKDINDDVLHTVYEQCREAFWEDLVLEATDHAGSFAAQIGGTMPWTASRKARSLKVYNWGIDILNRNTESNHHAIQYENEQDELS